MSSSARKTDPDEAVAGETTRGTKIPSYYVEVEPFGADEVRITLRDAVSDHARWPTYAIYGESGDAALADAARILTRKGWQVTFGARDASDDALTSRGHPGAPSIVDYPRRDDLRGEGYTRDMEQYERDRQEAAATASLCVAQSHGESAENEGVRRVNVKFAPSAYATLERLARRRGKTMSEVLRDAIQLESWLANAEDEGWHVLLERKGRVRELVRP